MKNMSFKKIILLSYVIIIFFTMALAVVSAIGMVNMSNRTVDNFQQITKPFEHMVDFSITYGYVRTGIRDIARASTDQEINRYKTQIEVNLTASLEHITDYRNRVNTYITDTHKRSIVEELYNSMVDYDRVVRSQLIPAGMSYDAAAVYAILEEGNGLVKYDEQIRQSLSELSNLNSEQGYYSVEQAERSFRINITAGISGIFVVLIAAVLVYKLVGRQINALIKVTKAADKISIGDIEIDGLDSGNTSAENEVILLERAFSRMIESFKKQAYILARIAEGDYTSRVEVRSDKDVINLAIQIMLDETLAVLKQVADAGVQVSDGSREIASGAQLLADGAAQQSATVEQLSASMSEMARMTRENASKADRAASLAANIKDNAEKGNRQMHDMIEAVKDINQASQNISKVIKIIDDIAFQTNILALNAAVEAARAGQHGKGFAVVAEEVRNLAAKSAEAAKDTGVMISNSMQKAELGSRIASETAASLEEIVAGIIESNQIVGDIAMQSNEQTSSIEQIDKAITQVAEVIHQNSATAQQSAAASDEMKGQSAALEELIMQFQLREQNKYGK
ncbi:MAG: methyl-accepting chemotaxis protein [Oscillospiraceae bacterium]|jgi:methyl-accepting chemotaxis protein|nr:methyl-accepting chemotaxis protein [Oscillospiraceae bacterium]